MENQNQPQMPVPEYSEKEYEVAERTHRSIAVFCEEAGWHDAARHHYDYADLLYAERQRRAETEEK